MSEPAANYQSKRIITIYSSFEEQKNAEDEYLRNLSPIDRIKEAVIIIKQVYKDELRKNIFEKKINFIKI